MHQESVASLTASMSHMVRPSGGYSPTLPPDAFAPEQPHYSADADPLSKPGTGKKSPKSGVRAVRPKGRKGPALTAGANGALELSAAADRARRRSKDSAAGKKKAGGAGSAHIGGRPVAVAAAASRSPRAASSASDSSADDAEARVGAGLPPCGAGAGAGNGAASFSRRLAARDFEDGTLPTQNAEEVWSRRGSAKASDRAGPRRTKAPRGSPDLGICPPPYALQAGPTGAGASRVRSADAPAKSPRKSKPAVKKKGSERALNRLPPTSPTPGASAISPPHSPISLPPQASWSTACEEAEHVPPGAVDRSMSWDAFDLDVSGHSLGSQSNAMFAPPEVRPPVTRFAR